MFYISSSQWPNLGMFQISLISSRVQPLTDFQWSSVSAKRLLWSVVSCVLSYLSFEICPCFSKHKYEPWNVFQDGIQERLLSRALTEAWSDKGIGMYPSKLQSLVNTICWRWARLTSQIPIISYSLSYSAKVKLIHFWQNFVRYDDLLSLGWDCLQTCIDRK